MTEHDDEFDDDKLVEEVLLMAQELHEWISDRYRRTPCDTVVAALSLEAAAVLAHSAPSTGATDRLFATIRRTAQRLNGGANGE